LLYGDLRHYRMGEVEQTGFGFIEEQKDFPQPVVQESVQAVLELETEECLAVGKYERSSERVGYRSGYSRRRLITRVLNYHASLSKQTFGRKPPSWRKWQRPVLDWQRVVPANPAESQIEHLGFRPVLGQTCVEAFGSEGSHPGWQILMN
jgi:mutator family transposase